MLVAGLAPLRMKVQSDFEAILIETANLLLDETDAWIRAAGPDFFELRGFHERDESSVPFSKNLHELPGGLIDQVGQRAHAVAVDLVVQSKNAFDHKNADLIRLSQFIAHGIFHVVQRAPYATWERVIDRLQTAAHVPHELASAVGLFGERLQPRGKFSPVE